MIGKIFLLVILILSCIITASAVSYAISKKMPINGYLGSINFTLALAIATLLVFLGI